MTNEVMSSRNFWYGVLTEALSLLVCGVLYPFQSKKLYVPKSPSKSPILCVHGYLHNETPWIWFKRQLRRAGWDAVNTLYYPTTKLGIPEAGLRVKMRVEQYRQATGEDINIFIGHSEGGLVCMEYALEHAPKDRLTYVIALGSPFHGTRVAKKGFGPACRQMEIGSPYLQHLRERMMQAEHIRLYAFATLADLVVVPPTSPLMNEWKWAENDVIPDLGHVALLFSPRVMHKILHFLEHSLKTASSQRGSLS